MAQQTLENEIVSNIPQPAGSKSASLVETQLSCDIPTTVLPDTALPSPDNCVICLDHITERAVALPCRHEQFDFPCLGTWLQRQQVCPLCKGEVKAVEFNVGKKNEGEGTKIFYLPPPEPTGLGRPASISARAQQRRSRPHGPYSRERGGRRQPLDHTNRSRDSRDDALEFRRQVYRHKLYSLRVGSNRISRYRNITPESFAKDERLISRARMWIRRELQVFDFLNSTSPATSSRSVDRRSSNADFLLEYIISILKSIDLKGSTGQAEELLKDFLGRENAKLFLHELEAWLRSPYEYLKDWDRAVQYAVPSEALSHDSLRNRGDVCRGENHSRSQNDRTSVPGWFSNDFVLRHDNDRMPSR
ncbi:hypothetical protein ABEF95_004519 [Exophiala dermatitidis]